MKKILIGVIMAIFPLTVFASSLSYSIKDHQNTVTVNGKLVYSSKINQSQFKHPEDLFVEVTKNGKLIYKKNIKTFENTPTEINNEKYYNYVSQVSSSEESSSNEVKISKEKFGQKIILIPLSKNKVEFFSYIRTDSKNYATYYTNKNLIIPRGSMKSVNIGEYQVKVKRI